jgi:aerobic carbon-monoxide dehydrogenase small subunit
MRFTLNGKRADVRAHPMARLLDVLREDCHLTGTKEGCGEGECGACTVLIDGLPVNSCLVPFAQADGARITTIEGLGGNHPLQNAFVEYGGAQCGICTPGIAVCAAHIVDRDLIRGDNPRAVVRELLAGNICRCTGYQLIVDAVIAAAKDVV